MLLKAMYDNKADIPEKFVELYSERDGKWVLSEVDGVKTQADVDAVLEAKRKETNDHSGTKAELARWKKLGESPEKVQEVLDDYPVQKSKAEATGSGDEEKIKQQVEARVQQEMGPVRRELNELKQKNEELTTANTEYATKETRRTIQDAVREAAIDEKKVGKLQPTAMHDVLMVAENMFEVTEDGRVITRDQVGVTPGIGPDVWFREMQKTRSHWWVPSQGGGAGGGTGATAGGKNPWSRGEWNKTEQARIFREEGREKAEEYARAAGVEVFATHPAPEAK